MRKYAGFTYVLLSLHGRQKQHVKLSLTKTRFEPRQVSTVQDGCKSALQHTFGPRSGAPSAWDFGHQGHQEPHWRVDGLQAFRGECHLLEDLLDLNSGLKPRG